MLPPLVHLPCTQLVLKGMEKKKRTKKGDEAAEAWDLKKDPRKLEVAVAAKFFFFFFT
jgi:hypothetical protein